MRDSRTQGPPIRRNLDLGFLGMESGSLGKAAEERVGGIRFGAKFGMELAGHEPRMAGNLDHLHQIPLGVGSADPQTGFFEGGAMGIVEFVTVPMTFTNLGDSIGLLGKGSRGELAGIVAQSHGGALGPVDILPREKTDDRFRGLGIEFRAVGLFQAGHIAGEFDDRDLHA